VTRAGVAQDGTIAPGCAARMRAPCGNFRESRWQEGVADMFKCAKCGKTSPKFTNCCGTPMKKG
jgi:hypothetical protein